MDETRLDEELAGVAALSDPTRRRLYASRPEGVGREEAAEAAGITRSLAAFHLDRLVEEGLLSTEYRRLTGRSGPGAGRPAKIYRRSGRQISLNLPPKNYELLARLMAQAFAGGPEASRTDVLASAPRTTWVLVWASRPASRPARGRAGSASLRRPQRCWTTVGSRRCARVAACASATAPAAPFRASSPRSCAG